MGDCETMPGKKHLVLNRPGWPRAKEWGSGSWLENLPFSDRLRQPDNHPAITTSAQRLTALRPCLATGLPLSCAFVNLKEHAVHRRLTNQFLTLFTAVCQSFFVV